MYYPYLRAKQYELKALREFSEAHKGQNSITPILEPVKQQPNALNIAIADMLSNGLSFALILNPQDGDFKHPTVHYDAWHQNEELMGNKDKWIPAFI
ncbi:MAG: sce7725 family protein [Muribaculaceae bacterium]|nr:sce7725 family protein [Muribaculaceae bacterium]